MKEFGNTSHWLYQSQDTWSETKEEHAERIGARLVQVASTEEYAALKKGYHPSATTITNVKDKSGFIKDTDIRERIQTYYARAREVIETIESRPPFHGWYELNYKD